MLDETPPARMRAIVQDRYGQPDVLRLDLLDTPVPRDDEVLIRVRAASVNQGDWVLLTGRPYPVRLMSGLRRPKQRVPGLDVAGEVQAVGRLVRRFKPGDAVFGEIRGAFAEYACAREDRLALKPANIGFEQAAAAPIAATTALQGLRDHAKVQPGARVLINGASGGVGSFAVQIARHLGAEVTGVCSTRNLDLVRSLGAEHVVDYSREEFTATPGRYDAILDLVGSAPLASCRRALGPAGVYVSSVGRTGWALRAMLASMMPGSRVAVLTGRTNPDDLAALAGMLESGALVPLIDRRFGLDEVPEALRRQGEGHARGKTTICP